MSETKNSSNATYTMEGKAAEDHHVTKPFFVIISVLSIVGNILVLLLFLKKTAWLKKAHNCLLFALALQDVLTALCIIIIPSFILSEDFYGIPKNALARELYCRLVWSQYLIFSLGITSIYTCVMLSFERWMAVVKPVYYRKFSQSRLQIAVLVTFPWIAAFLIELTTVFRVNNKKAQKPSSFVCVWEYTDNTGYPKRVFQALFMFFGAIVVPGALVVASYVQIIKQVKRSRKIVACSSEFTTAHHRTNILLRRMTVVAFIASCSVILCWLPSQIYFTFVQMGLAADISLLHRIFKLLAFSNSCMNPFVYCFSKASYRKVCKELLLQLTGACSEKLRYVRQIVSNGA